MPSRIEIEPGHVADVLDCVPAGANKIEPCYRSALRVNKVLENMGLDNRLIYAGGHCFSQVMLDDGLYYANAHFKASNVVKAPDNARARFGFDVSGAVGFFTATPDRANLLAIEAAEYSELCTDTAGPLVHSMTISEAETVFGAFEQANHFRGEGDYEGYCREVINRLEGKYVPLSTIYGEGLSDSATHALARVMDFDPGLGDAALTAIANTSVVPEITKQDLVRSVHGFSISV